MGRQSLDDMQQALLRSPQSSRGTSRTSMDEPHPKRLTRITSQSEVWGATQALARLHGGGNVCDDLEEMLQGDAVAHADSEHLVRSPEQRSRTPTKGRPVPELPQTAEGVAARGKLAAWSEASASVLSGVPGLLIGTTMNIMLSVPFGLAFFPAGWAPFPVPRAIGLQMFLFSTFAGQVVMTFGSSFPCAMGMMMVENIPFMHTLAQNIINAQGTGRDALATVMVAFAISTLIMGVCFMYLGQKKLGKAVSYFPRHFIIGCIGGIGIFVTQTGFEVSTGVPWSWNAQGLAKYSEAGVRSLWLTAGGLVALLNVSLRFIHWPLFPPFYFVGIIPVFYLVLLGMGVAPDVAREQGWLFEHPPTTDFWVLWSLFDLGVVRWDLIFQQVPTMVALTCFGLMHAPINIPSLSMSTDQEVDMNRELVVHGWSNLASGLAGGLPNYLCYSNSLLYHRCHGGGRVSGTLLCALVAAAFVAGPGAIAAVPRCMAGCLLIHVGLDLSREALVDSMEGLDTFEYLSVLLITLAMTMLGMTNGLGCGLVLSAMSFTLQHARHCEPVRGVMPATTLRSSARRSRTEREALDEALRRVQVVQLQGTLFFGNATVLTSRIEELFARMETPIRVLVLDFTLVRSLESSAADTIAKLYSVSRRHGTALVYNRGSTEGFPTSAPLSTRLAKLGEGVQDLHISDELDDALTWVEELLLAEARHDRRIGFETVAEDDALAVPPGAEHEATALKQLRALCPPEDRSVAPRLLAFMKRREVPAGTQLWRQGGVSDHCCLVSEGLLENRLEEEAGTWELCNPGCLVGEYHFLNREKRMGTLVAKEASVLYVLDSAQLEKMKKSDAYLAFVLARIAINYLGLRCHHISNRIWDTRCLPV